MKELVKVIDGVVLEQTVFDLFSYELRNLVSKMLRECGPKGQYKIRISWLSDEEVEKNDNVLG